MPSMEASHSNNPNPNSSSSSSSVRVLVRSQSSSSSSSTSKPHHVPSTTSPDPPPPSSNGVVVVGFIGPRPAVTTHLVNRVVDANVFGSGHCDTSLFVDKEELRTWFELRRISYYHDRQKGILFLQFSSTSCLGSGSAVEEEELEFGDLQGMLFMFSVCHVIIHIQDGLRFDTQLLKKFRVLQAAKHGLAPFVRSQITAGLPSNSRPPSSSQSSRPTPPAPGASDTSSPGKNRILSRGGASVSLMSGLGSYTSLFPGQCTPVMLFVFVEDFSDTPNPSSNVSESIDTPTSHNQSSLGGLTRPNMLSKGSGPVVVLARPVSKSEGGFKKTLQSSLESQIRFLIKKCRTFSGSEPGHAGSSRSGGISSSAPLFSLDSSRAVVLLDRSANQIAEPLEFATGLVEDVLNGKATPDSLLLESHDQVANKEDMLSVKDFIYRQSDILRGKGSSSSGSAGGAGMVAAAAAAAAASASTASGKSFATPELPNMEVWLSSSRQILNGILSAKGGCLNEIEVSKRKPRLRNVIPPPPPEGVASKVPDPLDVAVSWLGSGKGLNTRFSNLWCERTLPAAKEVYLKDLPPCYPTSMHEDHLDKALRAFYSMVKGPAVQQFAKMLEDKCISVWKSGRQLCDAVSLTGKPCMHQIHDLPNGGAVSGSEFKPHCSGYVFLHACACGRSRRLRLDPFDFESANFGSDSFSDCDKLVPAVQLPKLADTGPVGPSSWSLIRVGGAKYYEPSKGILQSGFCVTQKFLLKWEIFIENQKSQNGPNVPAMCQGSMIKSGTEPKFEQPKVCADTRYEEVSSGVENQRKPSETVMLGDKKISFGKALPNVTMRKPFAEVVAGSAAGNSEFPPLQQKKQLTSTLSTNSIRQSKTEDPSVQQTIVHRGSRKSEGTLVSPGNSNTINTNSCFANGDPCLRIGSYVGPINHDPNEKIRPNPSCTNVTVYMGFEHECPRGHRFILNPEHLKELGEFYQPPEESQIPSFGNTSEHRPANPSKHNSNGRRGKAHQILNRTNISTSKKERNNADRLKELGGTNGYPDLDKEPTNQVSFGVSKLQVRDFGSDARRSLDCVRVDNGGQAFSMLNRNVPLYMNCPHCRNSKNNQELPKVKFAGTVSQLQRIFLVTPPFPVVLATCPVIQFEASCLPQQEQKLRFSLGSEVVLPPESFVALRLPFIYGVKLEDETLHSLKYFEHQPEATAWIARGTTLQIVSKTNDANQ